MKATDGLSPSYDPGMLTFSQAQGYEELPGPLKLEELPREARTRIWNVFYSFMVESSIYHEDSRQTDLGDNWSEILIAKHVSYDILPLDDLEVSFDTNLYSIRESIETQTFEKVFNLIQFVLRHPCCPDGFIDELREAFQLSGLAYAIDYGPPPTIIPSATAIEGECDSSKPCSRSVMRT